MILCIYSHTTLNFIGMDFGDNFILLSLLCNFKISKNNIRRNNRFSIKAK